MQVLVQATGSLKREMKVNIPEQRIANDVHKRLSSLSKTMKIDGFRQGKVPFKVIENRYGKQVRLEVIGEMVQSSFYEAVRQENLKPAGQPAISSLDPDQGNGLSYTAIFEVMPEVVLAAIENLEVEKPVCEVTDEDYIKMVEVLRKQRQTLLEVDRPSKTGDTLEIDFNGKMEGEQFEGGNATDFRLELGANKFIAGFEDGLTGKSAGTEVKLDLKFPDEYQNEKLAGKPVQFEVKIKKVLESVLPELNEEFFKNFGIKDGTADAFAKGVREHMVKECELAARNKLRESVMNALHQANKVDLPEALVHKEAHRLYHHYIDRLKSYGIAPPKTGQDDIHNHDLSMFDEQAKKRVALQLIVMEIIRTRELKADPLKVKALIEKNASNYEDSATVINWYYSDRQRLAEVEAVVLEDELIDWVCSAARVNQVNVAFDELMNKGQTVMNQEYETS